MLRPQWFRSYTKHVPFGTAGCNNWLIARPSLVNSNTSVLVGMKEEKKWLYFQSHWLLTSANFDWRLPMFLWCLQMIGGSLCILTFLISAAMSTFGNGGWIVATPKVGFKHPPINIGAKGPLKTFPSNIRCEPPAPSHRRCLGMEERTEGHSQYC